MPNQTFIALTRVESGNIAYVLSPEGAVELELLASLGASIPEIAARFEVSDKWLRDYLDGNGEMAAIYDRGLAALKLDIRKAQMGLAPVNAQMAIWMGRQFLGQKDKQELVVTHKHRIVGTIPDFKAAGDAWLKQFAPPVALKAASSPPPPADAPVAIEAPKEEQRETPRPNNKIVDVTFTEVAVPHSAPIKESA